MATVDHDGNETTADALLVELAGFYEYLAAAEFDGYCDLYARIARGMAADPELLAAVITMAPATKVLPVLLNAAVHDLVLADPSLELAAIYRGAPGDPWPPFRALVLERFDELAVLTATRSIQTNEVGRSAILLPALAAVQETFDRPLALIELGPSAGLNLRFDAYHHDYGDGLSIGDPRSPVQLRCERRGPLAPPVPATMPTIAGRVGIDLNPVDVLDDAACRWLEACVWPLVPDRAERLRAAIALARLDPPALLQGAALDLLPAQLAAVPPDVVPCVVGTWVLAYFSKPDRQAFGDLLRVAGRDRDLACVTSEYPSVNPWIERPAREATANEGQAASVLGIGTWRDGAERVAPVAWTHAHGGWIDWLDAATAGPS